MTKISGIMALSARHFLLIPEDDSPFCPNLGNPKRYVVSPTSPGMSEDGFRHIYSTSLTAATESLTVTIWFEDSDPNCMVTRIQATFR